MKRFLSVLAIVLLLLVGAAIAVPYFFQDKIVSRFITEINKQLNAKVGFEDISLTMFKSFPNLALSLDGISVTGVGYFNADTLVKADNISLVLDLMSIIKGEDVQIKSVTANKALINLIVSENGIANWDIVKDDGSQTSSDDLAFNLENYSISSSNLYYTDRESNIAINLKNISHSGKGKFTTSVFDLTTTTNASAFNLVYGNVNYINNAEANLDAIIGVDLNKSEYTFKENKLTLNDLDLVFDGMLGLPEEGIQYDITWAAPSNKFKSFASLIPGVYQNDFNKLKANGTLGLNGFIKGLQSVKSYPAFDLRLIIKDGSMKYSGFDGDIKNINADCKIMNSGAGPDYTLIDLDKIHLEIDGDPFDARLIVQNPITDARIDGKLIGKIDLDKIKKLIPVEKGTDIGGKIDANLSMKGKLSDIENRRFENFDANGGLVMKNIKYYSSTTEPLDVTNCSLTFNPRNVTVNDLIAKIGNTSIQASGSLDNLIAYALKGDLLKGRFVLNAKRVDLNQLMDDDDVHSSSVIDVPDNLDLDINASIEEVLYEKIVMKNVYGQINIMNGKAIIPKLEFNTLEGSVVMKGSYSSQDIAKPAFNMNLVLNKLDIKKTYDAFQVIQSIAPIAGSCTGKFSSTLSVEGFMDKEMEPVENSLNGNGTLQTFGLNVAETRSLKKIADALKLDALSKNVFRDMNLTYAFVNGRLYVDPFSNEFSGISAIISGSNGFDQTLDFKMNLNIPVAKMGGGTKKLVSGLLSDLNKKTGTNVSMGDNVMVLLDIVGKTTDPDVKTNLKQQGTGMVQQAQQEIKDKVQDEKAKLEAQAQAEKERLEAEAKQKLEAEKAKMQAELDRKKKEAEAKAKAEAERLKKEAEQKAKDKLKDLFGKP